MGFEVFTGVNIVSTIVIFASFCPVLTRQLPSANSQ